MVLNGKKIAEKIKERLKKKIAKLEIKPGLAIILVGKDKTSQVYVRQKEKIAKELKVNFKKFLLPKNVKEEKILNLIKNFNQDKKIQGIIIQFPLPKKLNTNKIIRSIDPKKDVDGFHPENLKKLLQGKEKIIPPTIAGILELLKVAKENLKNQSTKQKVLCSAEHINMCSGKKIIILAKSEIFFQPLKFLLEKTFSTKLTIVQNVEKIKDLKKADVLISALGKPKFIKAKMIKKGVIIIDVGFSFLKNKISGDVNFENVAKKASYITPVPGGVGPLTVIFLFVNLLNLARR